MIKCGITGSRGVLGKAIIKNLPYRFIEFKKDITDKSAVQEWVLNNNFDILIHLAAKVTTREVDKSYKKSFNVNVNGTLNIIRALKEKKIKPNWLFFASTSHVYKLNFNPHKTNEKEKPKPQTKYGKTKLITENYLTKELNNTQIKLCIGRIFSFTDKNQRPPFVIPSITKKVKMSKKKIILYELNHFRDFLSTKDIVKAIDTLRKKKAKGVYNIGAGNKFCLKKISLMISKKYKKKITFIDSKKTSYLISDNKKILNLGWKPKKKRENLTYFY